MMIRGKRNDAPDNPAQGKKRTVLCVLLVVATLAYVALRFAPIGERTITLTALNKKSEIGQGAEIWIRKVVVNGEEKQPESVFTGKWVREGDYYKWRDFDQPDGMTDSLMASFPAGTDVDILFETNIWRGIVRITDGYLFPGVYTVDCWSNSTEGDDLVSYQRARMAPSAVRVVYVLLVYSFLWFAVRGAWRLWKAHNGRNATAAQAPEPTGDPTARTDKEG